MRYLSKTAALMVAASFVVAASALAEDPNPAEEAVQAAADQAEQAVTDEVTDAVQGAAAEAKEAVAGAQEDMAHHDMPEMSAEDKAMMEAWMKAGTPGEQHARMAEMVGTWKATVKTWMAPGEPQVSEGKATREMIMDGRILVERFEGSMMGMPFVGQSMFGYDNTRGKYWSTWVDSMSTGMMVSYGTWDEAKQELVQEGEFMDPITKQPITMRSVSRHPSEGVEVFEMWEPRGEGGEMVRTMEITYTKM